MCLRGALVFLASWSACYSAPTADEPCTITCISECPGDLTCENGFCVAEGEVCLPEFEQLSTGGGFACAIDQFSDLWCWGNNDHHQIDPGDQLVFPLAHRITGRKYQQVSAGRGHVCAISDGQLFCWGANERAQIGGSLEAVVREPTQIVFTGGPTGWRYVSADHQTTCAIADDGRLYCWGRNDSGQLGIGSFVDAFLPTPVASDLRDWIVVDANAGSGASGHTCAISASQGLFCWGDNSQCELANAAIADTNVPSPVALTNVTAISLADHGACAISEGDVYCWGNDQFGALGDPALMLETNNIECTPRMASSLRGEWTQLASAEIISCGLRGDEVYCWGHTRNGNGVGGGAWQLGFEGFTLVGDGASQLALGSNETFFRDGGSRFDQEGGCFLSGGAVRCWGDNTFGQLGQGAATETVSPLEITGDLTWSTLATGRRHACGIDDSGLLHCWGTTLFGAIDGTVTGRVDSPCSDTVECDPATPRELGAAQGVAVGHDHTCALAGNEIKCWGDNSRFQHGMAGEVTAPTIVEGAFTEIFDMHGFSTCGRTSTDTRCWGNFVLPEVVTELATMASIETAGAIQAGLPGASCFLDTANMLFCTGDNSLGQYGNGAGCAPGLCPTCLNNGVCDGGETTALCGDCGTGLFSNLGRAYQALSMGWDFDNQGMPVCGVTTAGGVECWGRNPNGMFTPGVDPPPAALHTPTEIKGLAGCTEIAVGAAHACAICGGGISCWGDHSRGAVGSGPQASAIVFEPRPIDLALDGDTWAQITAGETFTCARTTAGRGFCWGSNQHGSLGHGASASPRPLTVKTE